MQVFIVPQNYDQKCLHIHVSRNLLNVYPDYEKASVGSEHQCPEYLRTQSDYLASQTTKSDFWATA